MGQPDWRWTLLIAPLLVASGVVSSGTAQATSGGIRYASPIGVSTANCSRTTPCDLVTAIQSAPAHGEVDIEPGNYYKTTPITAEISDDNHPDLDIHGAAGKPPVIYSAAPVAFTLISSTLSNVTIRVSGNVGLRTFDQAKVNHVAVIDSASPGAACVLFSSVVDSLCEATGSDSYGVVVGLGSAGPDITALGLTLRGDTLIAPGPMSWALGVTAGAYTTVNVTAVNSIIHGTTDSAAATNGSFATATIALEHSDSIVNTTSGTAGSATVLRDSSDPHVAPIFVNAAAGDFRELPTSPTVNRGEADPTHDTDLLGNPRTAGGAPDMGAYEVLTKPAVTALRVTSKTAHIAHLTAKANSEGLATTLTLVASPGHHRKTVTVAAKSGAKARLIRITLRGLKAHHTYKLRAMATNAGGRATSATIHLTTD
jgi:hypothetical protein